MDEPIRWILCKLQIVFSIFLLKFITLTHLILLWLKLELFLLGLKFDGPQKKIQFYDQNG